MTVPLNGPQPLSQLSPYGERSAMITLIMTNSALAHSSSLHTGPRLPSVFLSDFYKKKKKKNLSWFSLYFEVYFSKTIAQTSVLSVLLPRFEEAQFNCFCLFVCVFGLVFFVLFWFFLFSLMSNFWFAISYDVRGSFQLASHIKTIKRWTPDFSTDAASLVEQQEAEQKTAPCLFSCLPFNYGQSYI